MFSPDFIYDIKNISFNFTFKKKGGKISTANKITFGIYSPYVLCVYII